MINSKICTIEIKGGKEIIKFAKKFYLKDNLAYIKIKVGIKISNDTIFILADNSDISIEDEKDFNLEDIIDVKLIHMNYSEIKNNNNFDKYINGNFKEIKIF